MSFFYLALSVQGKTLRKVILLLNPEPVGANNVKFSGLYVGFSRVRYERLICFEIILTYLTVALLFLRAEKALM